MLFCCRCRPGCAERHGFEYFRHGTLSLHVAFNTKTGEVLGRTAARHTSAEFVAFLAETVAHQPKGKEIHLIADNLVTHKTKLVQRFLEEHPPHPPLRGAGRPSHSRAREAPLPDDY